MASKVWVSVAQIRDRIDQHLFEIRLTIEQSRKVIQESHDVLRNADEALMPQSYKPAHGEEGRRNGLSSQVNAPEI